MRVAGGVEVPKRERSSFHKVVSCDFFSGRAGSRPPHTASTDSAVRSRNDGYRLFFSNLLHREASDLNIAPALRPGI